MVNVSRRGLLGGVVGLGACFASPSLGRTMVQPPSGDWNLSRIIERQLGDGNFVNVMRRWNLQFVAHNNGIRVLGDQTNVKVTAPERLAQLAKLEESRSDGGPFPMELSAQGLIHSAGSTDQTTGVAEAVRLAEAVFVKEGLSESKKGQARQFLSQLQRAAFPLLESLPPDLLRPSGEQIQTVESVQLPDGSEGQFKLEYWAMPQASSPWLDKASRIITTQVGESSRISSEIWTLSPNIG